MTAPALAAAQARVAPSRSARYRRAMESLRIRSESGRLVPMRFSQSQEIFWRHVAPRLDAGEKLWFIVLKARQIYSSTFFQALTFIRTLEYPGTHSLVIAHDNPTAYELFSKSKTFYEHLPLPKLAPGKVKELDFPFPEGVSKYRVMTAGSMGIGRGTTQTCVHNSEVAFWPHPEVMDGLFQAMPDLPNTVWVVESTANGMQGLGQMFYEQWQMAVRGESDLIPIFIPWHVMPKYRRAPGVPMDDWDEREKFLVEQFGLDGEQLAWRRYAIRTKCKGSVDIFKQEYPASPEEAFIVSGNPAFDELAVMAQNTNLCDPLWRGDFLDGDLVENAKGHVRLWKHPTPDGQYVIGADTAEGFIGGDYSCAEILDMATLEQVGAIHGTIPPHEFAGLLNQVGRYFNRALLCIEVYPSGFTVQDKLIRDYQYPNLHHWVGKPDQVPSTKKKRLYGWETNVWSRPLLIEAGQRAINARLVTLHEKGLLDEILRFTKNDDGKYEASAGHDDRVIALLLALRSRIENYIPKRERVLVSDESLPLNVRVADTRDGTVDAARRISKILKERAEKAVKSWMQY